MGLQWTVFSLPPLLAAAISLGLAAVAWDHRDQPTGLPFLVLMLALAGWSASSGLRLLVTDPAVQLRFLRLGTIVGAFTPLVWLVLTARYAEYQALLDRRSVALLALEPVAVALGILTNAGHNLLWADVVVASRSPFVLTFEPAIGHWLHLGFAYVMILAGVGLVARVYLTGSSVHRRQAGMLLIGVAIPSIANLLFNLGTSPLPGIDLTPATFTVTGIVTALALFRYDLLAFTPAAYRNVTDVLGDGVIVVDPAGTVREFNENAEEILGTSLAGGEPLDGSFPDDLTGIDEDVIEATVDDQRRFYDVQVSELPRPSGPPNRVVALRDVTPLREQEQRLQVTNRVLRHNIRNDANVIMGLADRLQADVDANGDLAKIEEKATSLTEVGDQARQIQRTMRRAESELVAIDVGSLARDVVNRFPDEAVTLEGAASATARGQVDMLDLALSNLVENAIEHHDREAPTVRVRVETAADAVTITVLDDGPGISDSEVRVLRSGEESQLEHGSGLGLWLVHWSVAAIGGDVEFGAREPRGTSVTIRLRPVTPDATGSTKAA